MTKPVPRVFHQIWVGGPTPSRFDAFRESWVHHHPDWQVRLWSDGDLSPLRNQRLYDAAGEYVPAANIGQFRADILRYEILWLFGGVYVDIDFEALAPIDELVADVECFAAWEVQDQWIANGFMGATARHPFIGRLIDELPGSVARRKGQTPNQTSGPQYLTRMYRRHPDELTVFDTYLFYPYLHSDLGTARAVPPWPDNAVAVHHWNNRRQTWGRSETTLDSRSRGLETMARDIDGDYKAAYIVEHDALKRAGRDDDAETVAKILRNQYNHDVNGGESSERLETADTQPPLEDVAEQRVSDDEHTCDECGFVAKSAAGLANHERSHE